jgi:hypothetical protein
MTIKVFPKGRLGLSTVVTTLIILVVAVLLASVVSYLAINITGTRCQSESMSLTMQHIWYDSSNQVAQAAFLIVNTGGTDAVFQEFTILGQNVPLDSVFYYAGTFTINNDLHYIPAVTVGSPTPVSNGEGSFEDLIAASSKLTLQSGESMIVYINNPACITINDVGMTAQIDVYTSQAMYHTETNVEAYIGSQSGDQGLEFTYLDAWYDSGTSTSEVAMVIHNTNAVEVDFDAIIVNGVGCDPNNDFFYAGTFTASSPPTYISNLQDGSIAYSQYLQQGQPFIPAGLDLVLYIKNPGGITAGNVGMLVGISLSIMGNPGTVDTSVQVQAYP